LWLFIVDQNEKADPEKVRKDREDLERRQKEEKARLQAEALAAKREAALEARRVREMEREAARRALQQVTLFCILFFQYQHLSISSCFLAVLCIQFFCC
jgi:CO/xanthine dehydrogenase Mo-binding subunit